MPLIDPDSVAPPWRWPRPDEITAIRIRDSETALYALRPMPGIPPGMVVQAEIARIQIMPDWPTMSYTIQIRISQEMIEDTGQNIEALTEMLSRSIVRMIEGSGERYGRGPGHTPDEMARAIRQGIDGAGHAAHADRRAQALLEDNLNPEQLAQWRADKCFEVRSQSGKRYLITNAQSNNIEQLDESGRLLYRHCVVSAYPVPLADQLLMQKLLIEHDEAKFWRLARSVGPYHMETTQGSPGPDDIRLERALRRAAEIFSVGLAPSRRGRRGS